MIPLRSMAEKLLNGIYFNLHLCIIVFFVGQKSFWYILEWMDQFPFTWKNHVELDTTEYLSLYLFSIDTAVYISITIIIIILFTFYSTLLTFWVKISFIFCLILFSLGQFVTWFLELCTNGIGGWVCLGREVVNSPTLRRPSP